MSSATWKTDNGHPLQEWRVLNRITQKELAKRVGCTVRTINHIESGLSARPSTLLRLFLVTKENFTPSMYFSNLKINHV